MRNPLVPLLLLIILLSACRSQPRRFVVGVSQCSVDNWREKFNDELRTAALLTDSLDIRLESANDDDRAQRAQIDRFIDEGVDLLIVSPNQMKSIGDALDRARERGIPVILFDRKSASDNYTAFIGCDNRQIGYAMGSYIAQRLGGRGRVAEIRGLEGSSPALERHNGFVEAIAEYPDIHLVASEASDWKREGGARAMKKILRQTHDIDYVFAHNDRIASGAREAFLADSIGENCLFSGVDALATEGGGLELVRDGVLDASYHYPTKGDEVVELALRILTHKPFDRENYLQTSIVTRENAELSLMEARDAEQQRSKLGRLHQQVDTYISQFRSQRIVLFALGAVLLLSLALVAVVYRALVARARMNHQLDKRNEELRRLNEQVIEQTHSRLVFFTNISHELRTPLTLIVDPVTQLETDPSIRGRSRELLALIKRNALALQGLVTTILDFRKIQNGKMTLHPAPLPVAERLAQWVADFGPTAERKRVHLALDTAALDGQTIVTDEEKLARIVFNLVSNALKYTPAGGSVTVTLRPAGDDRFLLSVRDTGCGIAPKDLPHVFDRFFQTSGAQAGTGVGLAVVKAYTELLQGTARVESEVGKGAEFVVDFPLRPLPPTPPLRKERGEWLDLLAEQAPDSSPAPSSASLPAPAPVSSPASLAPQQSVVLVIDDNDDIRHYLHTVLGAQYVVLEAADGRTGLETARSEVPDLILCDVMMPDISGLDVCRTLKATTATSHIPVIMLTAKALDEQRTEGYACGADSYITKPFQTPLLFARIENLLNQRALLRKHFSEEKDAAAPSTAAPTAAHAAETTFIARLRTVVERELGDSAFGVEELGRELGLSRVQLYRKVKALTGASVVDLLRRARLERARRLLATTHRTVSEVAYEVGFSSPSYFAKCFREEFGRTPHDYGHTQPLPPSPPLREERGE